MVSMKDIRAVGRRIAREFRPQRVILFGSHARGAAGPDSDVDLLVIGPFEGTGFRRSLKILNQLDIRLPVDLIAYRPEDVERRYAEGDPLIREASTGARCSIVGETLSSPQLLENVPSETFFDLAVAGNRLALAGLGVLIPIVLSAVTEKDTPRSFNFTDKVISLHAICRSPTCFTSGMTPLVRSWKMSLRFSCNSSSVSPWVR